MSNKHAIFISMAQTKNEMVSVLDNVLSITFDTTLFITSFPSIVTS